MKSKPARDAAAKAKIEAEASSPNEEPLHLENEWNIRYCFLSEIMHAAAILCFSLILSIDVDFI